MGNQNVELMEKLQSIANAKGATVQFRFIPGLFGEFVEITWVQDGRNYPLGGALVGAMLRRVRNVDETWSTGRICQEIAGAMLLDATTAPPEKIKVEDLWVTKPEKPPEPSCCTRSAADAVGVSAVASNLLASNFDSMMKLGEKLDIERRIAKLENPTDDLQKRIGKVERNVFLLAVAVVILSLWAVSAR